MANVLVIGGGIAGLSAAIALGESATVLERESGPGGCLRTDFVGPYKIDRTGHLFHMRSPRVMGVVEREKALGWTNHVRDARVMVGGGLRAYPIQYNLFGLPHETIADCVAGQAAATGMDGRGASFEAWARANFGDGLWELFFRPYNQKLWQTDLSRMTADWTGRFVPPPDIRRMVMGALERRGVDEVGYNATFAYPRTGASQAIVDALAAQVPGLMCDSPVEEILWQEKRVVLASGESLGYGRLVSTAPLDRFVDMLNPAPPQLAGPRSRLAHNSIGYVVFAGIAPSPEWHWTYVVDESLLPFRIGNIGAYGKDLAPSGECLFCVERAFAGSGVSEISDSALIDAAQAALRCPELGLYFDSLTPVHVGRLNPAYIIFTPERAGVVRSIRHWAARQGIASTGRYGAWTYGAAGDAVLQGLAAGRWLRGCKA